MKKIFTILGIVGVAAFANAQNLVINPGFENGTTGWSATNPGTGTPYYLPTVTTTNPYAGINSVEYTAATATTGFEQDIPVSPGVTYTISFWYKAIGDNTDARIWANYLDASNAAIYQGATAATDPLRGPNNGYLPASTAWTQHSVTVTAPANVVKLHLQVRAYNNSTQVAFDDFSVTSGTLAVGEVLPSKHRMIKNTFVKSSEITFGADVKDVKIFNMYGQVVKQASVKENGTVNVAELAKGSYIVTGTVNKEAVSQKILKD
ncbi:T9SS C-terminal target domain-containing protein [Chryseobacterium indologenes]|uniref:T9SS C-terminal target domain-containing protein n=1 Tax=Chryseobacterium indologenes TaxID=253 RepID=A0AAD0YW36_CHRID|nr:carbohydrate binding domain-containing protein [Chryseobacterium indologenes]AZB18365.1 T9SS C-terminal target domain-containing protein [Chryseobacterium indologenes]